jgi:diguanylate cyclase (GGDEF)-like protein
VEELSQFGCMLSEILSSEVSGILIYRDDKHTLLLTDQSASGIDFSERVIEEMLTRFNVLSGQSIIREDVHLEHRQLFAGSSSPSLPGKITSVPIIMGDDISGLVTLAASDAAPYSPEDISLLYHAANHVSSLFMTLQEIHALAAHDALTGLYNRLRMNEELAHAWGLSVRHGHAMGVLLMDLDHLKTINDTYGHAAGDDVLCEFADIIADAARASDTVARYGGDEFVIILPHLGSSGAPALAERILKAVRSHTFCEESLKLSASTTIGVATSSPEHPAESGEDLIRRADEALYAAKRAGRDQIQIWGS